jgi:hypothetical protein
MAQGKSEVKTEMCCWTVNEIKRTYNMNPLLGLAVFVLLVISLLSVSVLLATKRKREKYRRLCIPSPYLDHPFTEHLTQEQWDTHKEAFADYQCRVGKYQWFRFQGCIPEWLEAEGLPPVPTETYKMVMSDQWQGVARTPQYRSQ